MSWLHPEWLALLALWAPLVALVALATWRHRRRLGRLFPGALAEQVLPAQTRRRRDLRDLLMLGGLAGAVVALAEPAFDKQIVQVRTEGVDLVLAIDLSRSMDAQDVDPSRLARARREVQDLLALLTGDRVGVVFFAGEAIGRLPLTDDLKAVQWVLDEADTSIFRAQGSDLGKALDVGRELLARDEGRAGKAIVVLSDGETHAPDEAIRAAEQAAADGVIVYAVAIGDRPSPIPDGEGGWLRHEGREVSTVPDFATLEEVVRLTGGAIVKSVPSASDVERLYRGEIRGRVRAAQRDVRQSETWRSAYQVPLALGLLAWLAGAWLGDGRRPWGAAVAVLLTLSLPGGVAQAAPSVVDADALYRAGQYRRAVDAFEQLALERPDDPALQERLGAARYRQGDFVGAATAYERASRLRGGDADLLTDAGNARYRAGQLETAIARYEQALQRQPAHERATTNRGVVAGELEARRREQPPPPPEPSPGGEDDEGEGGDDAEPSSDPSAGDQQGEQQDSEQGEGEGEEQQQSDDALAEAGEDGEPRDQDQGEGSGQGQPSEQTPPDTPDAQQDQDSVSPDAMDPSDAPPSEDSPGQDGQSSPGTPEAGEASGNITPAQASRMLDAVEEGRQRVRYVGREGAKPW